MGSRIMALAAAAVLVVGASFVITPSVAEAGKVKCAANASSDIYVNPVVQRPRGVAPTGVSSPAECAFATITDAIAQAFDRGLAAGARIILTGGTASAPAILAKETFPLSFPTGITVTTTDDPDLGGSGLDPKAFVVQFGGRAAYAAHFAAGRVAGFTIESTRSQPATMLLICDEGTATLESLTLIGSGEARGLHAWSGCELDTKNLRVRGAIDGVVVDEGANVFFDAAKIYNNDDDGLVVRGEVSFGVQAVTEIAFNGDDGVLVERSSGSAFTNMLVRDNGGNGFDIHPSNLTRFIQNIIANNSHNSGWNQPQLLFVGPPTAGVPVQTDSDTTKTGYRIGAPSFASCGDANKISGYDVASPALTAVGIRAVSGAVVDAAYNNWVGAPKVTVDAQSFINTDPSCGGIGQIPPGPPIAE